MKNDRHFLHWMEMLTDSMNTQDLKLQAHHQAVFQLDLGRMKCPQAARTAIFRYLTVTQ